MQPATTTELEHSDGPCVIYHPTFGIYLATLIGDWWSAIDACGCESAATLKDRAEAQAFIQQCVSQPGYAPCLPSSGTPNLESLEALHHRASP